MTVNKNASFIFRLKWWDRMRNYSYEQTDQLMNSIVQYVEKGNVATLQGEPGVLFDEIRHAIDSDAECAD